MIAFFPGKFQPPHLGHILTIMTHYEHYSKIIIGISEDGPHTVSKAEQIRIFETVFKHLPKVEVQLIPGVLRDYTSTENLPEFDVCITGNPNIVETMKRLGKPCTFVERTEGLGHSGTALRGLK